MHFNKNNDGGRKAKKKYRFRWVGPAWLRRLKAKKQTKGADAKQPKPLRPLDSAQSGQNPQGAPPAMELSQHTIRMQAIEGQANLGNTMRMVDLSGNIVDLDVDAQARGASAALDEAAQALNALHRPPRPALRNMADTASMPPVRFDEDGTPRADYSAQIKRAVGDDSALAPYENAHMAMLRPARRKKTLRERLFGARQLDRTEKRVGRRVEKARSAAPKKKRSGRGAWIAAGSVCGALVLICGGVILAWYQGLFDASRNYVAAKEVYFDGHPVGTVMDAEELKSCVEALYEQLSTEYGVNVLADQTLDLRDAMVDPKYVSSADAVAQEVRRNIEICVNAVVIDIDGMSAVALETREDAQWVLDETLAPYSGGDGITETKFLEDVSIEQKDVDYSLLRTKEEAYQLLNVGVETAQTYTVASGDTLWSIAEKNGYTVAELRTANPAVANTDNLSVGMELSLMRPQKLLNVSSERVIEVTETLTHETQTITDDSMYSDQTVVRQKGSDGERKSTIQINYINGAEVSRETLSQVVTVEPVTEIIVKGTQKRPSNVSARGYLRPVNGGTITSGFGRRNRPTAGASSYHYGIDIGVGYGTPIMATRAGRVTYAGWNGGYGYMVQIDHGDGVVTRYGHCSRVLVSTGQYVSQGAQIALVGSTGVSTGNHLHFEVRVNGTAQDPRNYVNF